MIGDAIKRALRGILGWIGDQIPAPGDETPEEPLLTGIDDLPLAEQELRMRVWLQRLRRGRGDGGG